jgi:uncharacterized protein YkwD
MVVAERFETPRRAVLAALSGLLVAACAGRTFAARPIAVDAGAAAAAISRFRTENGLGPVSPDARLAAVAADQAMAMAAAGRMSHSIGWGNGLPSRLASGGYDWQATAENLGAGYPTLSAAMAGWIGSTGHRANLLKDGVTEFGIAAAESPGSEYRYFWALVLAAPRRPRSETAEG